MHILFTKEEIDKNLIVKFSRTNKVSHCPILISKKKEYPKIDFSKFTYLVLTSSNSLRFLNFSNELLNLNCFCVGSQTAELAKSKGFKNVISAGGNYSSLKNIFFNTVENKKSRILYLRGEYVSHDLEKEFEKEGYNIFSLINYTSTINMNFAKQIIPIINNDESKTIFLYSKRSSDAFAKVILSNNLSIKCKLICLRVISENALNPLKKIKWQNIRVFNIGDEEFCLD